jgi:hypothetical protein
MHNSSFLVCKHNCKICYEKNHILTVLITLLKKKYLLLYNKRVIAWILVNIVPRSDHIALARSRNMIYCSGHYLDLLINLDLLAQLSVWSASLHFQLQQTTDISRDFSLRLSKRLADSDLAVIGRTGIGPIEKHLKQAIRFRACPKNNCAILKIGFFTKRKQHAIL